MKIVKTFVLKITWTFLWITMIFDCYKPNFASVNFQMFLETKQSLNAYCFSFPFIY